LGLATERGLPGWEGPLGFVCVNGFVLDMHRL
jgi:hypothetical protein